MRKPGLSRRKVVNRISIDISPRPDGSGSMVRIFVDGRDLLELVRRVEMPQAQRDGQPELAGSYEVLHPDSWAPLHEQDDDDRIMIFGCDCGVAECWPLRVRIVRRGTEVTWSDFQQQNREWSYSTLGPFVFVAEQYDRVMREALSNR